MKKLLLLLVASGLVFGAVSAFAQEETAPTVEQEATPAGETATPVPEAVGQAPPEYLYPGVLPDHPLYFLKALLYKIREFFVFGDVAKTRWFLKMADKRAAEARELANKGKEKLAQKASEQAVAARDKAAERLKVAKAAGKDVEELVEKLEAVSIRQQVVLDQVLEKVPQQAKEAIRRAKERSKKGHERAIEVLRKRKKRLEEIERVEVEEKGCRELWWVDETHHRCQKKKFCGMYMYKGLQTFRTKEECEAR